MRTISVHAAEYYSRILMGKGQTDRSHPELHTATRIFEQDNKIVLSLYLANKGDFSLYVCISCKVLRTRFKTSLREVSDYVIETTQGKSVCKNLNAKIF